MRTSGPSGKERREAADRAFVDAGEKLSDSLDHATAGPLARQIDQRRDEAIENIAPRQHAHARALFELQDRERIAIKRLVVDLEQFVARIGLQHVDERLAGMTRRIETGAHQHVVDLAAHIGDGLGRARIGGRGEQAEDAEFADRLAVGVVALHADIIHEHAAMHARTRHGLVDEQRARLLEHRAHFRRHRQMRRSARFIAHDAEAGVELRVERRRVGGKDMIAHAEEW